MNQRKRKKRGLFSRIFRPQDNAPVCVYGPPEMLRGRAEPEDPEPDEELPTGEVPPFDPEENVTPCVYGPPEMFERPKEGEGSDE